jgi:hypothetical protein
VEEAAAEAAGPVGVGVVQRLLCLFHRRYAIELFDPANSVYEFSGGVRVKE